MRSNEIEILRCYLCAIEGHSSARYSEIKINEEDDLYGYAQKLVAGAFGNPAAKVGEYNEGDFADQFISDDPDDQERFVKHVTETVHELVCDNAELKPGTAICVLAVAEEQPLVGFFKLPFQEQYICDTGRDDRVVWRLNAHVVPKSASLRSCEYFLVNVLERKVSICDCEHTIDDAKVNYLAEYVLGLKTKKSEKEKVDIIQETTIETIREHYPAEEVHQKIMDYRTEVAEHVEQTGRVSVAKIEEAVFADKPEAAMEYRERLEQERIEREPMAVSKKTERQYMKKQKLVADNGIEILVPVAYLKNADYVEYIQDEEGHITIVLKEIRSINA